MAGLRGFAGRGGGGPIKIQRDSEINQTLWSPAWVSVDDSERTRTDMCPGFPEGSGGYIEHPRAETSVPPARSYILPPLVSRGRGEVGQTGDSKAVPVDSFRRELGWVDGEAGHARRDTE